MTRPSHWRGIDRYVYERLAGAGVNLTTHREVWVRLLLEAEYRGPKRGQVPKGIPALARLWGTADDGTPIDVGLSESTIRRAIETFETLGWVSLPKGDRWHKNGPIILLVYDEWIGTEPPRAKRPEPKAASNGKHPNRIVPPSGRNLIRDHDEAVAYLTREAEGRP
jgi:hypothetical protein